jgi:uncharacterized protein (DUF1015 family)
VSSPAYDLVTPAGRERLADADPQNIVRLILPHGDHAPELAARTLRAWQAEGVLDRDEVPALWLYEMRHGEGPATVGWLGAVALPPVGSTAVLPHEDTYPVAVEGRRALLAATATDLEPIVLAHDPEPVVAALAEEVGRGRPTLEVADTDDVRHRLWRVSDRALLERLTAAFGRTEAVIADGHHRFAAARANARARPAQPGSDAVLALLTPSGAGGLRVDPIHRVVPELDMNVALAAAEGGFRVTEAPTDGGDLAAAIGRWLGTPAPGAFLLTDGHRLAELTDPTAETLAAVPQEAPAAWRELDVVLAHHGLLEGRWHHTDDPESVLIAHTVDEALHLAGERAGVAVLLRAPSPSAVAAVARAGARMPRKSTLFVPKPRTGLVLRPLAD